MSTYLEAKKRLEQARIEMQEAAKDFFHDGAKVLFEKYPRLESFSWRQYTPYFNDGDECVFSAYTDDDSIEMSARRGDSEGGIYDVGYYGGERIYDWGMVDGKYQPITLPGKEEDAAMLTGVAKFLQDFTEDNLKEMFGDHVMITVDRKGVEVREYDHD